LVDEVWAIEHGREPWRLLEQFPEHPGLVADEPVALVSDGYGKVLEPLGQVWIEGSRLGVEHAKCAEADTALEENWGACAETHTILTLGLRMTSPPGVLMRIRQPEKALAQHRDFGRSAIVVALAGWLATPNDAILHHDDVGLERAKQRLGEAAGAQRDGTQRV
jgi:hypothetical protein